MSHENSITIQNRAGKWINISTVRNGKQLSNRDAEREYFEGRTKPLGGVQYDDVDSAVKAAKERSESFGKSHK